jgi:16S rRNA (cytosine967-C5)-methyltransferase
VKDPRRLAVDALLRIEEGAYANLAVPAILDRNPDVPDRDRHFVTDLVYGATRMRRTLDFLVDRFVDRDLEREVRAALRLGAYQLVFLGTPPHAAVSATVDVTPKRARGLVNAVLRRVAADLEPAWPDDATRLSYPDWIVDRLVADLGADDALAALEQMNRPAEVHRRDDGYIQDPASEGVARYVDVQPGERVADLCAAPGGKATLLGHSAELVLAADLHPHRARLVADNALSTGTTGTVATVVADAANPPTPDAVFDRVLLDAPCSGLGVLRRRPDARWRIQPSDVDDLASLQRRLLDVAIRLTKPGGTVVYSACTLTDAETVSIDRQYEHLESLPPPAPPWQPLGRGGRLLPQTIGSDGMYVLGLRKPRR